MAVLRGGPECRAYMAPITGGFSRADHGPHTRKIPARTTSIAKISTAASNHLMVARLLRVD
jgi:hypothetical protein